MIYPYSESYSAMKRNEILLKTATWLDLKSICQVEKSDTQDYNVISFIFHSRKGKNTETESKSVVARG